MNKDELLDYVKEFLRRAIASTLKMRRDDLVESMVSQNAVNQCLTTIMAIGYNDSLDAAVDDLHTMRSTIGGATSRKELQLEVQACYNTFRVEVAGFERMHEMNNRGMDPKDIWDFLRSRVPVDTEYEDNWLEVADAWILHGEKIALEDDYESIYFAAHPPTPGN